jgi:hypothetical protein
MRSASARLRAALVQVVGNLGSPELIEVAALGVFQPGAHLQAIRLQQVQRAQHAVEAAQDRHSWAQSSSLGLRLAASRPS